MDPGLELSFDSTTGKFTVEATTGVTVWTWLDYPAGELVRFEDNGFALLRGRKREVGAEVVRGGGEGWAGEVTVGSLWDNTVA